MHTSPTNTPSLFPQLPGSAAAQPRGEGSANLFETELRRASGDAGTGESERAQRQVANERRTAQAEKADTAQTQREGAREQRGAREGERAAERTERLEQRSAANEAGAAARRARGSERSASTPTAPERPAETPARDSASLGLGKQRPDAVETPEPPARGASPSGSHAPATPAANVQAAAPSAPSAPRQTSAPAAPPASGPAPAAPAGHQAGGQPQSADPGLEQRERTQSAPKAPTPARDFAAEYLVNREAALDRQASILRQLQGQLRPGAREVSLQLSPAALGRIDLRVALKDGRLTAVVRASSPEALDALENQLPELTANLEAQGLEVDEYDLALFPA